MSKKDTTEYRLTEAERYVINCAINHCIDVATCDIGRIEFRRTMEETGLNRSVPDGKEFGSYELTNEHHLTIFDALDQTIEDAVHTKVSHRMKEAKNELITQGDHHNSGKQTTSPRFTDTNTS